MEVLLCPCTSIQEASQLRFNAVVQLAEWCSALFPIFISCSAAYCHREEKEEKEAAEILHELR